MFNNCNRLITNSFAENNLITFLNTFNKTFHNWLYRLILRQSGIFGTANQAMVTSIQNLYDNNTINRGLSIFKNRYYPFIYDVIDDTGSNTFLPPQGPFIDTEVKAYKLNDTNGNMIIQLNPLNNDGVMIDGYTTEFWFKQISQTGVVTNFMGLEYWTGSGSDHASLHVFSNGLLRFADACIICSKQ